MAGSLFATARCAGSGASNSRLISRRRSHAEYRRAFLADAFAGTGEGSREQFFSPELDPVLASLRAASSPRAARDPNWAARKILPAYRGLDIGECFLGVFDGAAVEAHRFAVCIGLPGTPHACGDVFGVEHGLNRVICWSPSAWVGTATTQMRLSPLSLI
jgi:hypothetical protein